jgi:hypothetical protein
MLLPTLFWVFLVLCLVGAFAPDTWPNINRGRWVIILILLVILGLQVFGGIH